MKSTKLGLSVIIFAFVLLAFTSCQEDNLPAGTAAVVFRASNPATGVAALKNAPVAGVVIESFKINIREIELELDDDDCLNPLIRWTKINILILYSKLVRL